MDTGQFPVLLAQLADDMDTDFTWQVGHQAGRPSFTPRGIVLRDETCREPGAAPLSHLDCDSRGMKGGVGEPDWFDDITVVEQDIKCLLNRAKGWADFSSGFLESALRLQVDGMALLVGAMSGEGLIEDLLGRIKVAVFADNAEYGVSVEVSLHDLGVVRACLQSSDSFVGRLTQHHEGEGCLIVDMCVIACFDRIVHARGVLEVSLVVVAGESLGNYVRHHIFLA